MSATGKIDVSALSFDQKMTLLSELAKSLVGQGSSVKTVKTEVKTAAAKKEKDPDAPKREATPLFKARTAYIAEIKVSHAERFAEEKAAGIKYLTTAKSIIDEDKPAFDAFVANFIGSSPAPAPAPAAAAAATPKKLNPADLKKAAEAKKAPAPAAAAVATPPKPASAKPLAAPPAPKKQVKTVKPAPLQVDDSLAKIEIEGDEYLRDTKTQALWRLDEDGHQGSFVGYYQAGNEDEPIRCCEHPEEE